MQDELLLRQWTAAHDQFSADLARLFAKIRAWPAARTRARRAMSRTYAATQNAERALHTASDSLLGGLAAVATTAVLFTAVVLVANASLPEAGIASPDLALASEWKTASSSAPDRQG